MEMNNNFNQVNNQVAPEGAISPIVYIQVPEALKGIPNKRPEDKLYIIMYYYGDDERGFELCTGRMECYETIGRLVETYPDLQIFNSVVLVEVLAVSRENKAEWMLKHPHNAPTIYQFCKNTEQYFPNSDFHIDDYATEAQRESADSSAMDPTPSNDTQVVVTGEMEKVYKDIMAEKENQ